MDPSTRSPSLLSDFKPLKVAIVGGGIGGLSAAIALRRAGHLVEIFERRSFDIEVSSFLACATNGTQWLREWEVNIPMMKPVITEKFIIRDWETGRIVNQYDLGSYETDWGNVHYTFHRRDLQRGLLHAATSEEGKGIPCRIVVDHICESVDYEAGAITFENGRTVMADLIIGADGIRSVVRKQIGITPNSQAATIACHRCFVPTEEVKRLGLVSYSCEPAIQVWGGIQGKNGRDRCYKVVMGPCSGGDIVSLYCFIPSELTNHHREGFEFKEVSAVGILQGSYNELDPDCVDLIRHSVDRMPWRMYVHQPYEYWHNGKACILGDAAHPMLPHQAQGACQAIEDAAALGIIFSRRYSFTNNVEAGLAMYEKIRKDRATRVQQASSRGGESINERLGFKPLAPRDMALAAAEGKLTINEMNLYKMHDHIAAEVDAKQTSRIGHVRSRL